MESRFKRICISGASGTGKTTMAHYISEVFNIPYLNSSSSILWPKYGFKNHEQVHRACMSDPSLLIDYQYSILTMREKEYEKMGNSFVTDRGPLDLATYFLNYAQTGVSPNIKADFLEVSKRLFKYLDSMVFIRFNNNPIEDNGKRILDKYYQYQIDAIMSMLLLREDFSKVPMITLDLWDIGIRKTNIINFLTPC